MTPLKRALRNAHRRRVQARLDALGYPKSATILVKKDQRETPDDTGLVKEKRPVNPGSERVPADPTPAMAALIVAGFAALVGLGMGAYLWVDLFNCPVDSPGRFEVDFGCGIGEGLLAVFIGLPSLVIGAVFGVFTVFGATMLRSPGGFPAPVAWRGWP